MKRLFVRILDIFNWMNTKVIHISIVDKRRFDPFSTCGFHGVNRKYTKRPAENLREKGC